MLCSLITAKAEVSMYIDDFSIEAGETKTVAVNLTNDAEITAFQCDLYLSDGLSFVFNEEEESYNWLNYDRAAKKHVYEGAIQTDGALRMLVYHMSNTIFSGNSGAIVYCYVKASETFEGTATITVKNIECTSPDETQYLPTETVCTVTGPEPKLPSIVVKDSESGSTTLFVESGATQKIKINPDMSLGWIISSVTFDGIDVTSELDSENCYTTPAITSESTLAITYVWDEATDVSLLSTSNVKVYSNNGTIEIKGIDENMPVAIYSTDGTLVKQFLAENSAYAVSLPQNKVYLVVVDGKTFKVAL